MKYNEVLSIPLGLAVCYSGYREGQKPGDSYPSYEQVKEDLLIVQKQWSYIRLYSCDQHSNTVLEVIQNEKLNLRVMLGAFIEAEVNNPNCPWGGSYNNLQLAQNIENNLFQMNKLIELANEYPNIIFSLSVGNEACVDWTDHLVPVESVIKYVEMVKSSTSQPVTFCENYVPWLDKLEPLVDIIDFISIHTYPVWEYKTIDEGMQYTIQNYNAVANKYPNKLVVITEAGWATRSNGLGIPTENVNPETQKIYYRALNNWSKSDSILTFVFEAFDEPWKGSEDPNEPEKHWGLFTVDRKPKLAMMPVSYK
ncbi:MAG: glycosyl hydrolase family 17 protein [Flavobacteriaceae bacterium]